MSTKHYSPSYALAKQLGCHQWDFVAVSTEGGEVWFGYIYKVKHGLLKLVYVAFYSPACPCEPVYSDKALIPIDQITGVQFDIYYGPAPATETPAQKQIRDAINFVKERKTGPVFS